MTFHITCTHLKLTMKLSAHSNVDTYHNCTLAQSGNGLCCPEISSKTAMKSKPVQNFTIVCVTRGLKCEHRKSSVATAICKFISLVSTALSKKLNKC